MKNLFKNEHHLGRGFGKRVKCFGYASNNMDYFFILFTDDTVLLLEAGMDGEDEPATIEIKKQCDLTDEQILCINKSVEESREGLETGWESALTNTINNGRYFSR